MKKITYQRAVMTIRIPIELFNGLDKLSSKTKISRTNLIEDAIDRYLKLKKMKAA